MELLRQLAPRASTIGMLVDPNNPKQSRIERRAGGGACARAKVTGGESATQSELDAAFTTLARTQVATLLVGTANHYFVNREHNRRAGGTPRGSASYTMREFVDARWSDELWPDQAEVFRQTGIYAGRVLKGEKPVDLPVMQSTKFELVINLKTAKALGLDVPPPLLARADEVIE